MTLWPSLIVIAGRSPSPSPRTRGPPRSRPSCEQWKRNLKALRVAISPAELFDHPLVSIDQRGHPSMAFRALAWFLQQPDLVSFRVVQVGDPTVRSLCGSSQEHGSAFAQFLVGGGEVVDPEDEETFGGFSTLPGRASMDRQPNRTRVEVDDVALVEEERQAEDVSIECPRSIQVFRIPDDPLDGEGHSIRAPRPQEEAAVITLPLRDGNSCRALRGSKIDSPRESVEDGDVQLVPVGGDAGHREDVSRGKASVAIRVGEREGAVREGPENPAREGDVRQHRDSVLQERRTQGPVQGELGTPERKVRGRMPRVRSLGGER